MTCRSLATLFMLTFLLSGCSAYSTETDLMETAASMTSKVYATLSAGADDDLEASAGDPEPSVENDASQTTIDKIKNAVRGFADSISEPSVIHASESAAVGQNGSMRGEPLLPTATPAPDAPRATVVAEKLNVRSGPNTSFEILETLDAGDSLEIIGRSDDGAWFEIRTPENETGWVFGELIVVG